ALPAARRLAEPSRLESNKPAPKASAARVATMNPNFGVLSAISSITIPVAVQVGCGRISRTTDRSRHRCHSLVPGPAARLRPFGAIVSPRANIATNSAIFLARPAGVFMLFVRKASAERFWRLGVASVFRARGLASIAARRSAGRLSGLALRIGAYAA